MDKLDTYAALLTAWQERMNLVGPATLADIWNRHFADSAQLARLAPPNRLWLDIGAGGGFPGLVLATMGVGRFVLVDSVAKKCRFLEAVRDALELEKIVTIHNARVETLKCIGAEVVTARAAAALDQLMDWAVQHLRPGGLCLFPKGRRWKEEVDLAQKHFRFELDTVQSMTDPDARILIARNLTRR